MENVAVSALGAIIVAIGGAFAILKARSGSPKETPAETLWQVMQAQLDRMTAQEQQCQMDLAEVRVEIGKLRTRLANLEYEGRDR